jgi:hypothetical protein
MRHHARIVAVFASALSAAVFASACARTDGAEGDRVAGERATRAAEQKAAEATLSNATIETREGASEEGDSLRERAELLAAVRREQLEYAARVRAELDAIEQGLAAGQDREPAEAAARRRDALKQDLDALHASTGHDWATLKARLDRQLSGGSGDPGAPDKNPSNEKRGR